MASKNCADLPSLGREDADLSAARNLPAWSCARLKMKQRGHYRQIVFLCGALTREEVAPAAFDARHLARQ
jgi:hypothetical protein